MMPVGFVTVEEQQAHRAPLFVLLVLLTRDRWTAWRYRVPTIGSSFLCGLETPAGVVAYHLPMHFWDALSDIPDGASLPRLPEGFMHDKPEKLLALVDILAGDSERITHDITRPTLIKRLAGGA